MEKVTETDILLHLRHIQSLVSKGAEQGFNPLVGIWAEELFHSQQTTSKILKTHTGDSVGKPSDNESILLRVSDILINNMDTLLTEHYIPPEMILSFHENLHSCKRAVDKIKLDQEKETLCQK